MMNEPMTMLGDGRLSILDVLEVKIDTFKPEDVPALEEMARQALPEYKKRATAYAEAEEYERQLAGTMTELDGMRATAAAETQKLLVASADEIIGLTASCNVTALAARLRPVQDQLQLLTDAQDLLRYKREPAARIQTLEAVLNFRKLEELMASIAASLSHARTLSKLIKAGIFQNENRVAVISEETENLRGLAKEAARRVKLAEDGLREERKRQATLEQQRIATGQVTRAEVAAAIPVYAGHA